MADYTKREQRASEMRETLARNTDARYTIFSNDFDPSLRTPNLTLGQATRVLQSRTGCKVYFERMDRGLGVGFRVPRDPTLTAPTAGSVRLNIVSRETDIVEAKKELVLACILGGIGGFRGLPNPVFKRHLRNLTLTAPTAGSVRLNIVSRETDIVEAKKELVLACILGLNN